MRSGLFGLVITAVAVAVAVAFFVGRGDRATRSRTLRRLGFGVSAVVSGLFGLFLVGETLSDPGGWQGVGLIAAWLLPLAGAVVLAVRRPHAAGWAFAAALTIVTGLSTWFAIDPSGWRAFEDQHGPVRTVFVFALSAAIAVYGLERTGLAGVMLLFLGICPVAISTIGRAGQPSLAAVSAVPVITGALYITAALMAHPRPPTGLPPHGEPPGADGLSESRHRDSARVT